MSSYALGSPLTPEMNEQLRMESGWTEVGKGLGQILLGYLIIVGGSGIGMGMIMAALFGMPDEHGGKLKSLKSGTLWVLYLGLGIMVLINFFGYVTVARGQFRCMMSASERKGARWFMFLCMTCLFIGPAFNIVAGIAGAERSLDLERYQSFTEMKYTQTGQTLRLTGFALGLLYPLGLVLFLRAVACCMHSPALVMMLNLFLLYSLGLVGWTGYILYDPRYTLTQGPLMQGLTLGWVVLVVGYLVLIGLTRFCVLKTMERVRSPLDY